MRARTARFIRTLAVVSALGAAANLAFLVRSSPTPGEVMVAVISGAITGFLLTLFEIQVQSRSPAFRKLPLLLALLLRTAIYGAVFVFSQKLVLAAMQQLVPLSGPRTPIALNARNIYAFVGISLAINIVFLLRRLLGTKTLMSLATGRYRRPRVEERVVLFFDLRGSTALAERLGDAAYLDLLNRVLYLVTDPVLVWRGEIYRYVGDEVIVTWPAATGLRDAACVSCLFAVVDAIAGEREVFLKEFGEEPRLRAALHVGPLMVGIIGDLKTEIVMLGDTMNTTARIEDACRVTGHDYIISGDLRRRLPAIPDGIVATPLQPIPLRGKEAPVDLFALALAGERPRN